MDNKTRRILEQFAANPVLNQMKNESSHLGVTPTYNSTNRNKLWDSARDKKEFKNTVFQDKKLYDDPISGQALHSTQKAAQRKYHMKYRSGKNTSTAWAKHSPETDHIIPLKEIHRRVKTNPFLTDADVKEIANHRSNYRVTSKSFNTSKGKKSDFQVALDRKREISLKGRAKLVKEKIGTEASINTRFALRTVKHAGAEFADGAKHALEAAAIPILVESVSNLCKVASGEKRMAEAAKDVGKLTLSVAATGGGLRVVSTGVTHALKNSQHAVLKNFANSNQVVQVLTISLIVKDSVVKFVSGEIDGNQFFEEIGEKGLGLFTGTIGAIAGQALIPIPVVGAAIGSMIVSTVCMDLYADLKKANAFKEMEAAVSRLAADAREEMNRQHEVLQQLIQEEFTEWSEQFRQGYEQIYNGTIQDSPQGIYEGLSCILSVFSKEAAFRSQEEFDEMFLDEHSVFTM